MKIKKIPYPTYEQAVKFARQSLLTDRVGGLQRREMLALVAGRYTKEEYDAEKPKTMTVFA